MLADAGANIVPCGNAQVRVTIVDSIPGAFNHNLPEYTDEAYIIDINNDNINISELNPIDFIRAAQTLAQLAIATDTLESCLITDWPAFKMRRFMHDVGRSFISIDELKKEIRLLSQFKINTIHWHMTDNQAWRFEVKAYPQFTSGSATVRFPGQFFTQDQCREIMEEAKKYGVTVISEIARG